MDFITSVGKTLDRLDVVARYMAAAGRIRHHVICLTRGLLQSVRYRTDPSAPPPFHPPSHYLCVRKSRLTALACDCAEVVSEPGGENIPAFLFQGDNEAFKLFLDAIEGAIGHPSRNIADARAKLDEIDSQLYCRARAEDDLPGYEKRLRTNILEFNDIIADVRMESIREECGENQKRESARLLMKSVTEDGNRTRKLISESADLVCNRIRRTTGEVKSTVISATQERLEACHHPKKEKDKFVQAIIVYLAKPGVVFSIHDACQKTVGSGWKKTHSWLYAWCHSHEREIHDAVDAYRCSVA